MKRIKNRPSYQALHKRLQTSISKNRQYDALDRISQLIDYNNTSLFKDTKSEKEYIRSLWMYRIQLLMEWKKYSEALAWTCLECEMNPRNAAAFALKEELKQLSKLFTPENDALSVPRNKKWENVAGMREIKAILEEEVILPILYQDLYERNDISPLNGVLLYGPPGCGKTFIVENLAKELNLEYFQFSPSEFGSPYIHGSQIKISETFNMLKEHTPCLAFFDEIEALIPSREKGLYHSYSSEVNEFLIQLNNSSQKGILIIGATNYIKNIDEAALRPGRFDKKIFIGPPDLEARAGAFRIKIESYPYEKINYLSLAEDTEMFSFSDIELIVQSAIRKAVKNNVKLTQGLLYEQILKSKPSLTDDGLRKYYI